jgi:N-methylhydantoinase A
VRIDLSADLRYFGQGYEVNVAVEAEEIEAGAWGAIRKRFDERHQEKFGNQAPGEAVEIGTYRAVARAAVPSVVLPRKKPLGRSLLDAVVGQGEAYFGDRFVACTVYRRDGLEAGHRFAGPAVIVQMDATTLVRPGQQVHVDEWLNLVIEAGPEQ